MHVNKTFLNDRRVKSMTEPDELHAYLTDNIKPSLTMQLGCVLESLVALRALFGWHFGAFVDGV